MITRYATTITAFLLLASLSSAPAQELREGPTSLVNNQAVHPLELLGETRDKRPHWYSLPGKKHYVYKCAETNLMYICEQRIPLVMDRRTFKQQHPILNIGIGASKIMIIGAWTAIGSVVAAGR